VKDCSVDFDTMGLSYVNIAKDEFLNYMLPEVSPTVISGLLSINGRWVKIKTRLASGRPI
jgi:hypothetical protein